MILDLSFLVCVFLLFIVVVFERHKRRKLERSFVEFIASQKTKNETTEKNFVATQNNFNDMSKKTSELTKRIVTVQEQSNSKISTVERDQKIDRKVSRSVLKSDYAEKMELKRIERAKQVEIEKNERKRKQDSKRESRRITKEREGGRVDSDKS